MREADDNHPISGGWETWHGFDATRFDPPGGGNA